MGVRPPVALFTSSRPAGAIKVSASTLLRASHGFRYGLPLGSALGSAGALVEDQRALQGAVDTLNMPRFSGVAIRLVTNTASRYRDEVLQDLQRLSFAAGPSELATAPLSARSWLEREQRQPVAMGNPAITSLFAGSTGEPPDRVLRRAETGHHSSPSSPPTGTSRTCLRPSLISNSSPGLRPSRAV